MQTLTDQLVDELDRTLVHPVRSLLGLDLGELLAARLPERAEELAASLTANDGEAAATAREVMNALWPDGVTDHDWWRTTLGLVCARALGATDGESVSQQVAADMLGVTRGTVAQMMHRGTLDRHPDGGVLRASVLQRLNSRSFSLVHARLTVHPLPENRDSSGEWTFAVALVRPGSSDSQILLDTHDRDEARRAAEEQLDLHDYVLLGWLPDAC